MFALEQRDELIKAVMESAAAYVGVAVKQRKTPITLDQFLTHRLGKYRYMSVSYFSCLLVSSALLWSSS